MAFDLGWAQNRAQFSGVHPCSETDFLGTLARVVWPETAGTPSTLTVHFFSFWRRRIRRRLLQLPVLGFGLLQDRDVRVGVFPQLQKILVSGADAGCVSVRGLRGIALQ